VPRLAALRCALAVLLCLLTASCSTSGRSSDGWVVMLDLPDHGLTAVSVQRLGRAIAPAGPRELVRLDERECERLDIGGYFGSMAGAPVLDAQGKLRAIVQDGVSVGLPCIVSLAGESELEQARNRCLFLGGGLNPRTQQDADLWPVDAQGSVAAVGRVLPLHRSIGSRSTSTSVSATVYWVDGALAAARIQGAPSRSGQNPGVYAVAQSRPLAFVDTGEQLKLLFEPGAIVGRTVCVVGDYALLSPGPPPSIRIRVTLDETRSTERNASLEVFADAGSWQEQCGNALQRMLVGLDMRRPGSVRARIDVDGSLVKELQFEALGAQRISTMVGAELVECLRARTTMLLPEELRVSVELLSD
jgi:hypothetical protein